MYATQINKLYMDNLLASIDWNVEIFPWKMCESKTEVRRLERKAEKMQALAKKKKSFYNKSGQ